MSSIFRTLPRKRTQKQYYRRKFLKQQTSWNTLLMLILIALTACGSINNIQRSPTTPPSIPAACIAKIAPTPLTQPNQTDEFPIPYIGYQATLNDSADWSICAEWI